MNHPVGKTQPQPQLRWHEIPSVLKFFVSDKFAYFYAIEISLFLHHAFSLQWWQVHGVQSVSFWLVQKLLSERMSDAFR